MIRPLDRNSPSLPAAATALLLVAWTLSACHDARRANPLDPDLTPAVTDLQAAVDDSAGAVLLTWQPYAGRMPFAGYRVLRKIRGFEAVDTVAFVAERDGVRYADTAVEPGVEYEYRVAVVNAAGFAHDSAPVSVHPFAVRGVQLLAVSPDARSGAIAISWRPYAGPGFEGYEVWRRTLGQGPLTLTSVSQAATTIWQDSTAVPATPYTYWVRTRLYGTGYDSDVRQLAYALPRPRVTDLALSSDCACARLEWSTYLGPRFAAYEVRRRSAGGADSAVARIPDPGARTHVDSLLDGDTEYAYRVAVQTTWPGVEVASGRLAGQFHGRLEEWALTGVGDTEVQAIALAVDEADGLYAATTSVSSTTARLMQPGVRVFLPGSRSARTYLVRALPDRLSPLRLAAAGGWLFVAVADTGGLVAAAIAADGTEAWTTRLPEGRPAGLYADGSQVLLVDQQSVLYRLRAADGEVLSVSQDLRSSLARLEAVPLQDAAFVPAREPGGTDRWYLLAPERRRHKLLAHVEGSAAGAGGDAFLDDGVGADRGQVLDPLVLAHDARRQRLVVLESRGLLQVLDATPAEGPRRFVTRWGRFGQGPGEFLVTKPTVVAVAVDSQGRIYVADAGAPGGRIQSFAP